MEILKNILAFTIWLAMVMSVDYGWAREILSYDPMIKDHLADKLLPAKTSEYPTPAIRPLFSAMNCEHFKSIFGLSLPSWEKALSLCMDLHDK